MGPYSAAVSVGDVCYLAGKIAPVETRGGAIEAEMRAVFSALDAELGRAGLGPADVVQVTVYLVDMQDFAALNVAWAEYFAQPAPARACVAVSALPGGARVELAAIARKR
ncbi:MAG: RidA family protein [Planctomycetota bacterium]